MTHKQLVAMIGNGTTGLKFKDIERVLSAMAEVITQELASGEIVTLRDIGTFTTLSVAERMGTNPQTGEKVLIPASKRVKLKPCVTLKTKVQ